MGQIVLPIQMSVTLDQGLPRSVGGQPQLVDMPPFYVKLQSPSLAMNAVALIIVKVIGVM